MSCLPIWDCRCLCGASRSSISGQRSMRYDAETMSVYFWATPEGIYAGFPHFDGEGVKVVRHDRNDTCTPGTVRRDIDAGDVEEVPGLPTRTCHSQTAG